MKRIIIAGLLLVGIVGASVWWFKKDGCAKAHTQRKPRNVLLLFALPGSGKSEIRKYLASLDPQECEKNFGIGQTVQIDDFPYVHFMRRVSDECFARNIPGLFFLSPVMPFRDAYTWGVLTQLMSEDYQDIVDQKIAQPKSAAQWLFGRIEKAQKKVGAQLVFEKLKPALKKEIMQSVEADAKKILDAKNAEIRSADDLENKTVVMECARGGADNSPMPLPAPFGYRYSLSQFSSDILDQAQILYVWVTPAESRRKNEARANPNDPGSILNHCVPQAVMYTDYGCDDIAWLEQNSDKPHTVTVDAHGKKWHLPLGIFDNRDDKTTFVRSDRAAWKKADVNALAGGLQDAFAHLRK